jgi:hypothetical protein
MDFFIVLKRHTPHYIRMTFRKLLLYSSGVHLKRKAVAFETSCVYAVVYVFFLIRWKSFLLNSDVLQVSPLSRNSMVNFAHSYGRTEDIAKPYCSTTSIIIH